MTRFPSCSAPKTRCARYPALRATDAAVPCRALLAVWRGRLPFSSSAALPARAAPCPPLRAQSGFKGVHRTGKLKWQSQIYFHGKLLHLGVFELPEEAALAYQTARSRVNHIPAELDPNLAAAGAAILAAAAAGGSAEGGEGGDAMVPAAGGGAGASRGAPPAGFSAGGREEGRQQPQAMQPAQLQQLMQQPQAHGGLSNPFGRQQQQQQLGSHAAARASSLAADAARATAAAKAAAEAREVEHFRYPLFESGRQGCGLQGPFQHTVLECPNGPQWLALAPGGTRLGYFYTEKAAAVAVWRFVHAVRQVYGSQCLGRAWPRFEIPGAVEMAELRLVRSAVQDCDVAAAVAETVHCLVARIEEWAVEDARRPLPPLVPKGRAEQQHREQQLKAEAAAAAAAAPQPQPQPLKLAIGPSFDRPPLLAAAGEAQEVQLTYAQLELVLTAARVPQHEIEAVISRAPLPAPQPPQPGGWPAEAGAKRPGPDGADAAGGGGAADSAAKRPRVADGVKAEAEAGAAGGGPCASPPLGAPSSAGTRAVSVDVSALMKLTGGSYGAAIFAALRPFVPARPAGLALPPAGAGAAPTPAAERPASADERRGPPSSSVHPFLLSLGNGGVSLPGSQRLPPHGLHVRQLEHYLLARYGPNISAGRINTALGAQVKSGKVLRDKRFYSLGGTPLAFRIRTPADEAAEAARAPKPKKSARLLHALAEKRKRRLDLDGARKAHNELVRHALRESELRCMTFLRRHLDMLRPFLRGAKRETLRKLGCEAEVMGDDDGAEEEEDDEEELDDVDAVADEEEEADGEEGGDEGEDAQEDAEGDEGEEDEAEEEGGADEPRARPTPKQPSAAAATAAAAAVAPAAGASAAPARPALAAATATPPPPPPAAPQALPPVAAAAGAPPAAAAALPTRADVPAPMDVDDAPTPPAGAAARAAATPAATPVPPPPAVVPAGGSALAASAPAALAAPGAPAAAAPASAAEFAAAVAASALGLPASAEEAAQWASAFGSVPDGELTMEDIAAFEWCK